MLRFSAVASLAAALIAMPLAGHADGMPTPPPKHRVHHPIRHSHVATTVTPPAVAPVFCARPPSPPPPYVTAYDREMVSYFRCPSITGYRPGSATEESDGVRYQRAVDWSAGAATPAPLAPRPPQIDAFPYRVQAGQLLLQYDNVVGTYVALSARDAQRAAAAMAVAADPPGAPIPLTR